MIQYKQAVNYNKGRNVARLNPTHLYKWEFIWKSPFIIWET